MKYFKLFKSESDFNEYKGGGEIVYPLIAKVEDKIYAMTPPPVPTIYASGNSIGNENRYKILDNIPSISYDENTNTSKIEYENPIIEIPEYFMAGPYSASNIKFENFNDLQKIGHSFFDEHQFIETLEFCDLPNLETIGSSFLVPYWYDDDDNKSDYISILKKVVFGEMPKLQNFPELHNLYKLTELKLPNELPEITTINNALNDLTSLTALTLPNMPKLETIGDAFLYNMTGLKEIDLSPISNVTSIGRRFLGLYGWANHTRYAEYDKVIFGEMSNLTSIGDDFLSCGNYGRDTTFSINELYLPYAPALESIGENALVNTNINKIYCPEELIDNYRYFIPDRADELISI